MKEKIITGIQQIGIGVKDVKEAWKWYRENFGMDIRIFEEDAVAELMLPYTGGKPRKRHAALTMNLQGGGGFEIWQYTDRTPEPPEFNPQLGDFGIYSVKIKSKNVRKTHEHFSNKKLNISPLEKDPLGNNHFFVKDPYNNYFQIISGNSWFKNEGKHTGAVYGAIIGVSNIDNAKKVYCDILNYDEVLYDQTGVFNDFKNLPGGQNEFRRILLKHSIDRIGGFSKLFGPSTIELIEVKDQNPSKIFKNRFWGDLGFIHLCFDIHGMEILKTECEEKGFPFTVDSFEKHDGNSFDMGEAAGHFSYIEDPDGTLIEFVETHKVPIIKKLGWYFNLKKRNPRKNLPDWMIKILSLSRVKD